jgi:hypothetical protein
MKKSVLLLAVLATAFSLSASVNSTIVMLSPATKTANDAGTWTFGDGFKLTNGSGKAYGEFAVNAYANDGDTVREATLKLSRQVAFKIIIPADKAVVRVDFIGFSNSPASKNWDFLSYLDNGGTSFMVYKETGVAYGTLVNDDIINKTKYPISPLAKSYGVFASLREGLGWYSELNFLIDGNNQAGVNVRLYVVNDADMAAYKIENDVTMGIQNPGIEAKEDGQLYNMLGQPVTSSYKGLVIKNHKKFLIK